MTSFRRAGLAFAALALFSLARAQDAGTPQSLPVVDLQIGPLRDIAPNSFHVTSTHLRTPSLHAQIASTPHEGEVGLMYVKSMPDNDGMLFVLPVGIAQFWMKNTLIPLSIAYLDKNGTILELHDMKAMDETITRSDSDQVAYAIEANLHWFDLNGIKPGMKISPSPADAVKEADAHAAAH